MNPKLRIPSGLGLLGYAVYGFAKTHASAVASPKADFTQYYLQFAAIAAVAALMLIGNELKPIFVAMFPGLSQILTNVTPPPKAAVPAESATKATELPTGPDIDMFLAYTTLVRTCEQVKCPEGLAKLRDLWADLFNSLHALQSQIPPTKTSSQS